MIQKCSILKVLEIFFREPMTIQFIREISRKIKLAHTSVRANIKELLKEGLIVKVKSKPFDGFTANRESECFSFYKRAYNLFSLYELKEKLVDIFQPQLLSVFGSYSRGEDVETSDIDVLVVSKIKKKVVFTDIEKKLGRKINAMLVDSLDDLDEPVRKKAIQGFILFGGIDG